MQLEPRYVIKIRKSYLLQAPSTGGVILGPSWAAMRFDNPRADGLIVNGDTWRMVPAPFYVVKFGELYDRGDGSWTSKQCGAKRYSHAEATARGIGRVVTVVARGAL